jgi:hypothetical protein
MSEQHSRGRVLHNSKPGLLEAIFLTFIARNSYKMAFLWVFYSKLAAFWALAVILQHSQGRTPKERRGLFRAELRFYDLAKS